MLFRSKMMATVHRDGDKLLQAVKGAPTAVVEVCTRVLTLEGPREMTGEDREWWLGENQRLASEGRRVLALARGSAGDSEEDPYRDLTLLGLTGLLDPVRAEVREPVTTCRDVGIRVVMVTGHQEETAVAVAEELGLLGAEAGARPGS